MDQQTEAEIQQMKANTQQTQAITIRQLVDAGFSHESVKAAVTTGDFALLESR